MKKFIPFEKLSKKEQRKLNRLRRQTWGELCPITRRPENSKAYDRKKNRQWRDNSDAGFLLVQMQMFMPLTSTPSSARIRI